MASVDPEDGVAIEMPSIALVGEVRGMLEQCKSEIIGSGVTSITDTSSLTTYHQYFLRTGDMVLELLSWITNCNTSKLDDNPDISYFSITIIPTDGTRARNFVMQRAHDVLNRRWFEDILRLHIPTDDVVKLMHTFITGPDKQTTAGIPLIPPPLDNWYSVESRPNIVVDPQTTSTTTIVFPGEYPDFSTSYRWMERTKLHGNPPKSMSRVAIWGARSENSTTWSSLMAFSDDTAAAVYSKKLENLLASTDGELRIEVASHWMIGFQYVYRLGLNDARLRLMKVAERLCQLLGQKYQNISAPTIGGAHACLMLMNHLEYHQQLIQSFQVGRELRPKWQLHETPNWTEDLTVMCQSLMNDISRVYKDASSTRGLIIEQHNLSQSRNLGFLTVLATIFVPMTAVAGFFGMNTNEINGSNWSIKYFFASAVPFSLFILIPLVALQLLEVVLWLWYLISGCWRSLISTIIQILSLFAFMHIGISNGTGISNVDQNVEYFRISALWLGLFHGIAEISEALFLVIPKFLSSTSDGPSNSHSRAVWDRHSWIVIGLLLFEVMYMVGFVMEAWVGVAAVIGQLAVAQLSRYLRKRKRKSHHQKCDSVQGNAT
ncbi:putative Family metal ion transporter [Seiridium cardinale]